MSRIGTKEIYYDDTELLRLFEELTQKERAKALRGGLNSAAAALRNKAVANFKSVVKKEPKRKDSPNPPSELSQKGIWRFISKRFLGYGISLESKRQKLKDGEEYVKTLTPLWLEGGTKRHKVLWFRKNLLARNRRDGGLYRGGIAATGFMTRTKDQELPKQTELLKQSLAKYIEKVARKHGAKTN